MARFDVVRLMKPGKYLELGQLRFCCVIFAKNNVDVIRHCGVFMRIESNSVYGWSFVEVRQVG